MTKAVARLKIGTYNPGGALTRTQLIDDVVAFASRYGLDGLVLCEFGKRGPVLVDICAELPWLDVYAGDGSPGANSTPILWDSRRWELDLATTHALIPATRLPQPAGRHDPAGPQRVKRKPLNGVRLHTADDRLVDGERLVWRLGAIHAPASHWWPPRRQLATTQNRALDDYARQHDRIPLFVAGDWNTTPTGKARRPLRAGGWVSAQQSRPGGPAITHPKTSGRIDDVEHHPTTRAPGRPDRVWRPTGVRTLHNMHGDHLPTIASWALTEPR